MIWSNIPELVEALAPFLPQDDLSRCCRVSSLWYRVFNPYIWHTIDDREEPWQSILENEMNNELLRLAQLPNLVQHNSTYNRSWLDKVFSKNHHHVRNMTISYPHPALIQSFLQSTNKEMEQGGLVSIQIGVDGDQAILGFQHLDVPHIHIPRTVESEHLNRIEVVDRNTVVSMSLFKTRLDPFFDKNKWYRHRREMTRCCWQLLVDHVDTLESVDFLNSRVSDIASLRDGGFMYKVFQSFKCIRTLAIKPDSDIFEVLHVVLPSLESLKIHPGLRAEEAFYYLLKARHAEKEEEIVPHMCLKSLKWLKLTDITVEQMHLLFDLFPNLERLHLPTVTKSEIRSDGALGTTPLSRSAPKSLRALSVFNPIGWTDTDATNLVQLPRDSIQELNFSYIEGMINLIEILIHFPYLSSIVAAKFTLAENSGSDRNTTNIVNTSLPEEALELMDSTLGPLPNLEILHLGEVPSQYDLFLAQLLSRTPNLREFYTTEAYPLTVAALAAHCPKIQVLQFDTTQCSSDSICQLLVRCSDLREFTGTGHTIDVQEMVIKDEDGQYEVKQAWACLGLEHLQCKFTNVPSLEPEEEAIAEAALDRGKETQAWTSEEAEAVEALQSRQNINDAILAQLRQLHRLMVLDFDP